MKKVVAAVGGLVLVGSAFADGYRIEVLPHVSEYQSMSAGRALASNGTVLLEGATYSNGVLTRLGATGGSNDYAMSVNASGVVVGQSETRAFTPYGNPTSAFQWKNGVASSLNVSGWSSVHYIADDGTMLGTRFIRENGASVYKPFVIRNGVETVLPLTTNYYPSGSVNSVNASGTIVGASSTNNGPYYYRAAMWRNGTVQDLGTSSSAFAFSSAQKVLNDGRVWVRSSTDPYGGNATVDDSFWQDGVWTSLSSLGGFVTRVVDVNNSGTILGVTIEPQGVRRSFLYDQAGGFRLIESIFAGTPYVSSFTSGHQPVAINDAGQMLFGANYRDAAFNGIADDLLITPSAVPEPATLAALGLGVAAVLRRRPRRASSRS